MQWSYHIVDMFSGARLVDVTAWVSDAPWQTQVNAVPTGRVVLRLRGVGVSLSRDQWRDVTRPRARAFVWSYGDDPVAVAGMQIIDREWDPGTGELTLKLRDVRAALAERFLFRLNFRDPSGKTTLTSQTLYEIARFLILDGLTSTTPGDGWWTPIMFFSGPQVGSRNREWDHHRFDSLESLLTATQDWDGGPDVYFEAFWLNTTEFRWLVHIGQPGRLSLGMLEVFPDAAVTPVRDLVAKESAAKQVTGVFAMGDGSGSDRPVGEAGPIAGSAIPVANWKFTSSLTDEQELDGQAAGALGPLREPTTLVSFALDAPGMPASIDPGWTVRLNFKGDEFLVDGPRDAYVVGLSGDMSDRVEVTAL